MSLFSEGALALRRRSSWEAAAAGMLLWRESFIYFLPFFALPFWICAFGLRLLPERFQVWSWLILWFLRPLFDRPVLHIVSIRFFEGRAGMGRLCRGLGRSLFRGLAGDLLWRRFSPLRSAMMPVRVLEAPKFNQTGERRKILKRGGLGFCLFLTVWGWALEFILLAGETVFCGIMMEIIQAGFVDSLKGFGGVEFFLFTLWCINFMLIESIYVCMGFGLYINSRVEVEGWDIELLFRNFAEGCKKKAFPAALLLCLFFGLAGPVRSFAGDMADNGTVPLETLQTILDSPDFGGEKDGWGIRWKNPKELKEPPKFNFDILPWLEIIRQAFAFFLRLVLIIVIGAVAVLLFLYMRRLWQRRISPEKDWVMRSLPKTGEVDLNLLLERAEFFFKQGDFRQAWGFCAAAAIRSWAVCRGMYFPPDATEYGCLDMVMSANGDRADRQDEVRAFAALVRHWAGLAYGGRLPPEGSFEQAMSFCKTMGESRE